MATAGVLLSDVAADKGVSIPGDHSLRQAIAVMHQDMRKYDLLGRYGGRNFWS